MVGIALGAVAVLIGAVVVARASHSDRTRGAVIAGSPAASTPSGYTSFVDHADRFSIAVPAAWRDVDPSSPGAQQAFQDLVQGNPEIAASLGPNIATMVTKGMKFFSIDPAAGPAGRPSVNVIAEPALGINDSDLGDLAQQLPAGFAKAGATMLGSATIPLAGHQALQVTLEVPLTVGGQPVVLHETQDYVAANDLVYVITLTGTSPQAVIIASTFRVQ